MRVDRASARLAAVRDLIKVVFLKYDCTGFAGLILVRRPAYG